MTHKNKKFVLDTETFKQIKEDIKVITDEERLELEQLEKACEEKLEKRRAINRAELETYGILRDKDPKPTLVSDIQWRS